jgi:steroid 5-alpha reductase family enzyme
MKTSQAVLAIILCVAIGCLIALAGSQGSLPFTDTIPLFAACGAVGFLFHWLVFLPSYWAQTEHYFDLTGAVSFIAATSLALLLNPVPDTRTLLLSLLIIVWALRLGSFLFVRVKRAGQDRRFSELKTRFWRFGFTWTMGGLWVFLTMAAPLAAITAATKVPLGPVAYSGLILWAAGFGVEVIADRQKTAFRNNPDNADRFIREGLWAWSRHPNYFGEILLWIGLAIVAFPVLQGWQLVTLISPVFVVLLLTRVSGVPLLERKADEKWGDDPDYQAYKQNTPVLIPKPPR